MTDDPRPTDAVKTALAERGETNTCDDIARVWAAGKQKTSGSLGSEQ